MAAAASASFAFNFDQTEIDSTPTGRVILRVAVRPGSASTFQPATPQIDGLTPISTFNQAGGVVALFVVTKPGLYVLRVAGANAATSGLYELRVDVAGDIQGDARVDGLDSQLMASALGSSSGDAGYLFAADSDGDGHVTVADRQVLISNYGFIGIRPLNTQPFGTGDPTVGREPPDRPVFDLEPDSDTGTLGDGQTSRSIVTLVGLTTPGAVLQLPFNGDTTIADVHGMFAFLNVPLALGDNPFTVVATNLSGGERIHPHHRSRERGLRDERHRARRGSRSTTPGAATSDHVTSDATIKGTVADASSVAMLMLGVDDAPLGDITARLSGNQFLLTRTDLETVVGSPLADGVHTVRLFARDQLGNPSAIVTLAFTLDTHAPAVPAPPDLLPASDTGALASDHLTNLAKPTFRVTAEQNSLVSVFIDGAAAGQKVVSNGPVDLTAPKLGGGVYHITATAEDLAGNVSPISDALVITLDTTAPTAPTLGLDPAFDTAPLGDGARLWRS